MKESKLISKFNTIDKQIAALTNVMRKIISDLGNIENLAQGTLTSLQTFMGEKEWGRVIKELKEKDILKDKKEEDCKDCKKEKKLEL
jgi:ATP sulfurylase